MDENKEGAGWFRGERIEHIPIVIPGLTRDPPSPFAAVVEGGWVSAQGQDDGGSRRQAARPEAGDPYPYFATRNAFSSARNRAGWSSMMKWAASGTRFSVARRAPA